MNLKQSPLGIRGAYTAAPILRQMPGILTNGYSIASYFDREKPVVRFYEQRFNWNIR